MKTLTIDQFSEMLQANADNLKARLALQMLAFSKKVEAGAKRRFFSDDVPRRNRVRDTSNTRTGGPIGSWYRDYKNAPPTSGLNRGPRSITGNLKRSILSDLKFVGGNPVATISAGKVKNLKYAAAIEFGSPKKNIEPRRFIGRSFDKEYKTFGDRIAKVLLESFGELS